MRSDNPANNFVITSALLQYWAMGKTVLTPKLKVMCEVLEEGENGFLFDMNDPDDFALKLEKMMKRELRDRMGAKARDSSLKFDSRKVVAELSMAIKCFLEQV